MKRLKDKIKIAKARTVRVKNAALYKLYARRNREFLADLCLSDACKKYNSANSLHRYMTHYFCHLAPGLIREHRAYFSENNRGFGEDAFHSMWWTMLKEFKPQRMLEIGVYRGQTITLWTLIARALNFECEIHGVSPFTPHGDVVSRYLENVDYYNDTLKNFSYFYLPEPKLLKALSTDTSAAELIKSKAWDIIYIDGSHDYEIALADYNLCKRQLRPGGLLVLDDASLYNGYNPPAFSFGGHVGPSRVARDFATREMNFIGAVGHNNIFQNTDESQQ